MLKRREIVKMFYKMEIGNGRHISFWFDNWSVKGGSIRSNGSSGYY